MKTGRELKPLRQRITRVAAADLSVAEMKRRKAEYIRAWNYGMTVAELLAFMDEHGNQCGICGKPAEAGTRGQGLMIDHDHTCCHITSPAERRAGKGYGVRRTCGKCTRGLLCNACNAGIGQLGEDPDRFIAALAYLGVKVTRIQ